MYKTIDGRWGKVKFLLKDEYVGRSLYNYGEYNPDETEKIIAIARGTCLDIGANIGVIGQALLASGFEVVAFEPQPELAEIVWENFEGALSNGHGKFLVHTAAVGSAMGTAKMPKVYYSEKNNFGGLGIGTKSMYGSYDVPVVTIDSFNYQTIGFMKIDVEGYELEVLKGATETIARCRPVMYIEDDRREKSAALRAYITELGYSIEEHKPTLYRENNFFGLRKNIWDRNYASHNLICMPL